MDSNNKAFKEIQKKKKEEYAQWQKVKKAGFAVFIVKKGIIGFAVPTTIVMTIFMMVMGMFNKPGFAALFFQVLAVFVIAGVLYSSLTWFLNGRKYK